MEKLQHFWLLVVDVWDKGIFETSLVRSLIVLIIFWAFRNLVEPLSTLLRQLERYFTASMIDWLIKAIKVALIFIGTATVLEIWGIRIGPIIAGLGLFGLAVALGAQDLFKNLISGILIIAEKRFNPGDWIKVDGEVEGTVEDIGFRSTLIRQFDKAPVYVPNAKLSDDSLINYSKMSHRRIYLNSKRQWLMPRPAVALKRCPLHPARK